MDRDTAEPDVDDFPGEKGRERIEYQNEVGAKSTHVYGFVWDTTAEAIGPFCKDVDGNVLMDFTSHVASSPLGYNHPGLLERLSDFDLVDPLKFAGQDFYADSGDLPGPAELMHRLVDVTPDGVSTVFLSNSGAEAVENAIKVCYDHREGAKYGIAFEGAFHGRTLGALSLNRSKAVHRSDFPEVSGITSLPYCDDSECSSETCSCGFFPDGGGSWLREKLGPRGNMDPDEVAYIILEPVQGEGGYRIPSDAFMDEIAYVCDEHGIPLVTDEIQAGVGRTGEWWGADHYSIEPDVFAVAKSLRVGATAGRDEMFPDEKSRLSSTWGAGDVLSSAVGALTMEIIEDEDLMDNAVDMGNDFVERLEDSFEDAPFGAEARNLGLMVAAGFDTKERRDAVMDACTRRGLLTLPCGHKTLRLLPPLDVREREIRLAVEVLSDALADDGVRGA